MKTVRNFLLLSIIVLTACCSSIYGVSYDYDRNTDFSHLKTYDWLPMPVTDVYDEKEQIDTISIKRIKAATNNKLEAKGLEISSENPDFLIAVYLRTKERLRSITYGGPYVYSYYGYGPYGVTSTIRQYEEGTLLLDFVDTKSKQLIWRGSGKSDLDSVTTPEKRERVITEAVQKILDNFPPPTQPE
jgi:hypothetical protein